jgi:hypothetical protein
LIAVGLCTPLLFSALAQATLGEKSASIATNRVQMKSVQRLATVNTVKGYGVDESVVGGTTIRQYTTTDGTVFAITWDGIAEPDLAILLGAFKTRYIEAAKAKVRVRRSRFSEIRADGLVVQKMGHMRAYHGVITATDLMPSGLTAEDLQ